MASLQAQPLSNRHSGLDLLRIVAMLMVCVCHVNLATGSIAKACAAACSSGWIVAVLQSVCLAGVNLYVMITGYFCVVSQWRLSRYIQLWMQVVFYAVTCFALGELLYQLGVDGAEALTWSKVMNSLLPVPLARRYWFFTVYSALFMLMPFINPAVQKAGRATLLRLLALVFLVFIPLSYCGGNDAFAWGYNTLWFIVLYVAGAYLRLHPLRIPHRWLYIALLLSVAMTLCYFVVTSKVMARYTFPPLVLTSLCVFILFERLRIQSSWAVKWIGILAPLTFGVYLVHCSDLVWGYLERSGGQLFRYLDDSWWLFLLVPMLVYLASSLVDSGRAALFRMCRVKSLANAMESMLLSGWLRVVCSLHQRIGSWFGADAER